jgi:hypothetical protein
MTKPIKPINVVVSDRGSAAGRRKIGIEFEAASDLFLLSDMLAREGGVPALTALLQRRVRDAVLEYISSGREALREFKERRKPKRSEKTERVLQD